VVDRTASLPASHVPEHFLQSFCIFSLSQGTVLYIIDAYLCACWAAARPPQVSVHSGIILPSGVGSYGIRDTGYGPLRIGDTIRTLPYWRILFLMVQFASFLFSDPTPPR
jgi:hypothetical protein